MIIISDNISRDSRLWFVGVARRMNEQNIPEALACCRSLLSSLEADLKGLKQIDNTDISVLKTEYFEKIPQKNGKNGKKLNRKRRSK